MGRILSILTPLLIIAVLGVGGFVMLGVLKPEPEKSEPDLGGLNVFAEQVIKGDLELTVEAQGEVRPQRELVVAPQISGRVSYVSPDLIDGGFVQRGQLMVRVEAADFELAVVRAQSGVASARQRLVREQAEAQLAIQDIKDLGLDNVSPLARREPQLAEAQASLDAAEAQLQEAKLALNRTAVYAPFSGRVRERSVNIGQVVSPGQSLGRIFANDVVEVSLPLNDLEMGRLGLPLAFAASKNEPGPAVVFQAPVGGKMRTWHGHVARTAAAVNSQTRLINVIAEVIDPYGAGADGDAPMAPGLFVNATIKGETIPDVYIAPRAAMRGDNRIYIGNPEEGTLSIREVEIVYSDPDGAYVKSGIEVGELAVVSPIQAAFDGMNITVLERLSDGTVKTHERDSDTNNPDTTTAATTNSEGGAP